MSERSPRRAQALILSVSVLALAGCTPLLGKLLVSTPNRFNPLVPTGRLAPPARQALGVDQQRAHRGSITASRYEITDRGFYPNVWA